MGVLIFFVYFLVGFLLGRFKKKKLFYFSLLLPVTATAMVHLYVNLSSNSDAPMMLAAYVVHVIPSMVGMFIFYILGKKSAK